MPDAGPCGALPGSFVDYYRTTRQKIRVALGPSARSTKQGGFSVSASAPFAAAFSSGKEPHSKAVRPRPAPMSAAYSSPVQGSSGFARRAVCLPNHATRLVPRPIGKKYSLSWLSIGCRRFSSITKHLLVSDTNASASRRAKGQTIPTLVKYRSQAPTRRLVPTPTRPQRFHQVQTGLAGGDDAKRSRSSRIIECRLSIGVWASTKGFDGTQLCSRRLDLRGSAYQSATYSSRGRWSGTAEELNARSRRQDHRLPASTVSEIALNDPMGRNRLSASPYAPKLQGIRPRVQGLAWHHPCSLKRHHRSECGIGRRHAPVVSPANKPERRLGDGTHRRCRGAGIALTGSAPVLADHMENTPSTSPIGVEPPPAAPQDGCRPEVFVFTRA